MTFASIPFLFAFLPTVILLYLVVPKRFHNALLLTASIFFYFWDGGGYVALLGFSALCNYALALLIAQSRNRSRVWLGIAIAFNLGILGFYKYAHFVLQTLGLSRFATIDSPEHLALLLPLGISFFTFHALSYLIDVYRRTVEPQKSVVDLGLYLFFFPQLIAGPIVRYKDISAQLHTRTQTLTGFADGCMLFAIGLGKKVLLANSLAPVADAAFASSTSDIGFISAWVGIAFYSLQLYFDFSGYSDMAIGLARMFGFSFPQNFNYPYSAHSIQDFWRRWHMSLSTWFRDYVYIPLGGSRDGNLRTVRNLMIVFLLVGIWHGAAWTFILWGLWHGTWLVVERVVPVAISERFYYLGRIYTLMVVMLGLVLFRSPTVAVALDYIRVLFSPEFAPIRLPLDTVSVAAFVVAVVVSFPIWKLIPESVRQSRWAYTISTAGMFVLLCLSVAALADGTYNPFIYYHF